MYLDVTITLKINFTYNKYFAWMHACILSSFLVSLVPSCLHFFLPSLRTYVRTHTLKHSFTHSGIHISNITRFY